MPSPEQRNPEPEAPTPESSEPSTADTPTSPPDTTPPAADADVSQEDTAEHHVAEMVKQRADELEREGLSERFDSPPGRDLDYEPGGHLPDAEPREEIGYQGER